MKEKKLQSIKQFETSRQKRSKVLKLRVFTEDKLLGDGVHVSVSYAIALYDMGVGKDPVLQLSAISSKFKHKLVNGDLNSVPILPPTLFGAAQMQLTARIRARLGAADAAECNAFRRGSYLQVECKAVEFVAEEE